MWHNHSSVSGAYKGNCEVARTDETKLPLWAGGIANTVVLCSTLALQQGCAASPGTLPVLRLYQGSGTLNYCHARQPQGGQERYLLLLGQTLIIPLIFLVCLYFFAAAVVKWGENVFLAGRWTKEKQFCMSLQLKYLFQHCLEIFLGGINYTQFLSPHWHLSFHSLMKQLYWILTYCSLPFFKDNRENKAIFTERKKILNKFLQPLILCWNLKY